MEATTKIPPGPASSGPHARGGSRDAILDAAIRVVGCEGLPAASLSVIAKEAGISKAALLYHFGSRDDLLVAVADAALDLYRSTLDLAGRRRSGDEDPLRSALAVLFTEENRPIIAATRELASLGIRDPRVAKIYLSVYDKLAAEIAPVLRESDPERALRRARGLLTAVQGHFERWLCTGVSDPGDAMEDALLAVRCILRA